MLKLIDIHVMPNNAVFLRVLFGDVTFTFGIFVKHESVSLYNHEENVMLIHNEDGFKWIPIDYEIHEDFYKCPEVVKKILKLKMTDFLDERKMEYTKNFIKNLIKQSDPSFDEGVDK